MKKRNRPTSQKVGGKLPNTTVTRQNTKIESPKNEVIENEPEFASLPVENTAEELPKTSDEKLFEIKNEVKSEVKEECENNSNMDMNTKMETKKKSGNIEEGIAFTTANTPLFKERKESKESKEDEDENTIDALINYAKLLEDSPKDSVEKPSGLNNDNNNNNDNNRKDFPLSQTCTRAKNDPQLIRTNIAIRNYEKLHGKISSDQSDRIPDPHTNHTSNNTNTQKQNNRPCFVPNVIISRSFYVDPSQGLPKGVPPRQQPPNMPRQNLPHAAPAHVPQSRYNFDYLNMLYSRYKAHSTQAMSMASELMHQSWLAIKTLKEEMGRRVCWKCRNAGVFEGVPAHVYNHYSHYNHYNMSNMPNMSNVHNMHNMMNKNRNNQKFQNNQRMYNTTNQYTHKQQYQRIPVSKPNIPNIPNMSNVQNMQNVQKENNKKNSVITRQNFTSNIEDNNTEIYNTEKEEKLKEREKENIENLKEKETEVNIDLEEQNNKEKRNTKKSENKLSKENVGEVNSDEEFYTESSSYSGSSAEEKNVSLNIELRNRKRSLEMEGNDNKGEEKEEIEEEIKEGKDEEGKGREKEDREKEEEEEYTKKGDFGVKKLKTMNPRELDELEQLEAEKIVENYKKSARLRARR